MNAEIIKQSAPTKGIFLSGQLGNTGCAANTSPRLLLTEGEIAKFLSL